MTRSEAFCSTRNSQHAEASIVLRYVVLAVVVLSICWLTGCNLLNPPSTPQKTTSTGHLTLSAFMPTATVGVNWNTSLTVSGGTAPYTFSVTSGNLPTGLLIRTSTGTISGTPQSSGSFAFTVQAVDSTGLTGTSAFNLSVSKATSVGVTVTPASVSVTSSGTEQFTASVTNTSNVAVTWAASTGTISSSGLYTAPKVSANTNATVTATSVADGTKSSTAELTITPVNIVPLLSISTSSLPSVTAGASYSDNLAATGGTSPYKWSMYSGTLPSGVNLGSGGSLSGTTSQTGTYTLTVEATDSSSPPQTATRTFNLTVNVAMTGPKIALSFFGADYNAKTNWPPVDGNGQAATLGSIRLWDDNVKWAHIETSSGVYDWTLLDDWLDDAAGKNMDVLYTFGDTPQFATTGAPPGMCLNSNGYSCVPPADVNADGTGTDAYFQAFVTAIVTHAAGRIAFYELWNEPDCNCFFNGTTAQLIRMSKDASAIIRSLDPNAKILSPSYHDYSLKTKFDDYVTQGGAAYFDIVNMHMRGLQSNNTVPETFLSVYSDTETELAKHNLTNLPLWDDEHGIELGQGLTDPDELAGYVARSAILRAGVGLQRQYVYQWDSIAPYGLQNSQSGTAWDEVANWLIGHQINACAVSGTVYTCQVDNGQIVWDSAQTCSNGACTTSKYTYPSRYNMYKSMTSGTGNTLTGSTVQIGYKPIFLTNQ